MVNAREYLHAVSAIEAITVTWSQALTYKLITTGILIQLHVQIM